VLSLLCSFGPLLCRVGIGPCWSVKVGPMADNMPISIFDQDAMFGKRHVGRKSLANTIYRVCINWLNNWVVVYQCLWSTGESWGRVNSSMPNTQAVSFSCPLNDPCRPRKSSKLSPICICMRILSFYAHIAHDLYIDISCCFWRGRKYCTYPRTPDGRRPDHERDPLAQFSLNFLRCISKPIISKPVPVCPN
jgi:hypothetical protein